MNVPGRTFSVVWGPYSDGSEPGEEVLDGINGGLRGGVEYVVVVGVPDLDEDAIRDGISHPVGFLRGKDKALVGSGQADGREQYEGRAPDARPQVREREPCILSWSSPTVSRSAWWRHSPSAGRTSPAK
jgi:hypothetical protein